MRHLAVFFSVFIFLPSVLSANPAAPTNLQLTEVAGGMQLTWRDNSSDELGFYVYRDNALRADTTYSSLLDTDLTPGARYCYQVSSFASNYESAKTSNSCLSYVGSVAVVPVPEVGAVQPAFDYPVKTEIIYRTESGIPADAWYDYQPFGALFNFSTKIHLGIDLNKGGGDGFEPLYSIGDCLVHDFDDTTLGTAWGKWLILRCDSVAGKSFRLANGQTTNRVYVLYAHIDRIRIVSNNSVVTLPDHIVKGVTKVGRGWLVATVGNANGYYGAAYHLHFEIRVSEFGQVGPGYVLPDAYQYLQSHTDPLEFIANNRFYDQKEWHLYIHAQDIDRSMINHLELAPNIWRRIGRSEVSEKRSLGYNDDFWLTDSLSGSQASWNFKVPISGSWEIFLHLPHTYATASQVRYTVWHDDLRYPNPYLFDFNQARGSKDNQRVYVGSFNFNSGKEYAVAIAGLTQEVNRKQIAVDALELVGHRNDGVGGAVATSDGDGDGMESLWEIGYGLNPNLNDSTDDPDLDGLNNLAEYYLGTSPITADTDGDGESDGAEYANHYDPLNVEECSSCPEVQESVAVSIPITQPETPLPPGPITEPEISGDPEVATVVVNPIPEEADPTTEPTGVIYNKLTIKYTIGGLGCAMTTSSFENPTDSMLELLLILIMVFVYNLSRKADKYCRRSPLLRGQKTRQNKM